MITSGDFSRVKRLLSADVYTAVFERGQRFNLSVGLYIVLPTEQATARLGLIVAKKRLAKAVKRNHLKRCQREAFRLSQAKLKAVDIVFLVNNRLTKLTRRQMTLWCKKDWLKLSVLLSA